MTLHLDRLDIIAIASSSIMPFRKLDDFAIFIAAALSMHPQTLFLLIGLVNLGSLILMS